MHRDYHKWFSPRLDRNMEMLTFGHAGARVVVFPTRQGRFFDYENFGMVDSLRAHLEHGHLQLFCVDSLDSESLYALDKHPNERIARHNQFERYILEEVLPYSAIQNPNPHLVAHGCSIGAYHAVNIALRHPHHFTRVVALSGRYDLTEAIETYRDLFDGYYDQEIYFHIPNHFLPNLEEGPVLHHLRHVDIRLAIGFEDWFRPSNEELSRILSEKQISHRLDYWDGKAHNAEAWREMLPTYF